MWSLKCDTENIGLLLDFLQFLQFSIEKNGKCAFFGGKFFSKSFEFLTGVKYTSKNDFYHVVTQVEYWKQWSPTGFPSVFTVFFEKTVKKQ